jgi:hypothetical protein
MKRVFLFAAVALLISGCAVKNNDYNSCKLIKMKCQSECKTAKCKLQCAQKYNNCVGEESEKNFASFVYEFFAN